MGWGTFVASAMFWIGQVLLAHAAWSADFDSRIRNCNETVGQGLGWLQVQPAADPCREYDEDLLLYIDAHRALYVCEQGQTVMANFVSRGKGGIFKTRQGDKKTPIGRYKVGMPRPSDRFGIFIPIDYPNEAERQLNYTGSEIGLHGPTRKHACHAAVGIFNNWTDGCIAYVSDTQIHAVALWVLSHPHAEAVLRAQ